MDDLSSRKTTIISTLIVIVIGLILCLGIIFLTVFILRLLPKIVTTLRHNSTITIICLGLSLVFYVLHSLLYHTWTDVPGWLVFFFGSLGLPWIILIKLTKQDHFVEQMPFKLQLKYLPICDSRVVQQMQEQRNKSTEEQAWLETRTYEQVISRYGGSRARRDHYSLKIKIDGGWRSAYFNMSTTLMRIGTSDFLDYSTSSTTNRTS